MSTAQPGALHSRRLFEKYGEFDKSYRVAGDYEFLLRARATLLTAYVDDIAVKMLSGGASVADSRVFRETELAKIKNGAVPQWIARLDRYIAQCKRLVRRNFLE